LYDCTSVVLLMGVVESL